MTSRLTGALALLVVGCAQPLVLDVELDQRPWPDAARLAPPGIPPVADPDALPPPHERFGWSVATLPDLTGDGLPEIVVGDSGYGRFAGAIVGIRSEELIDGEQERVLMTAPPLDGGNPFRYDGFGWAITRVSDDCMAVGAAFASNPWSAQGWLGTYPMTWWDDPEVAPRTSWWGSGGGERLGRGLQPFGDALVATAPFDDEGTVAHGTLYQLSAPCAPDVHASDDGIIAASDDILVLQGNRARDRIGFWLGAATLVDERGEVAQALAVGGGTALLWLGGERREDGRHATVLARVDDDDLEVLVDVALVVHPDLTGDGVTDAVVRWSTGEVAVYAGPFVPGTTARPAITFDLHTALGAMVIAHARDSGREDLWIGAPAQHDDEPSRLFRVPTDQLHGRDRTLTITEFQFPRPLQVVGDRMWALDVDDDGLDDLVVSAWKATIGDVNGKGAVEILLSGGRP